MAKIDDASIPGGSEQEVPQVGTNEIPSISFRETGYNGLTVLGGQVFEDCSYELRWR